ncbi:MAG: hypothetical protein HY674_16615 [Chloroflexi bacterium]|nr:hypothetical protein [Chloroflexota bacterium]
MGQYCDADGDGIPDSWEQQYFGSITNCAHDADPDGDGMPNLPEYLADTNPFGQIRNPKSEIVAQMRMARWHGCSAIPGAKPEFWRRWHELGDPLHQ